MFHKKVGLWVPSGAYALILKIYNLKLFSNLYSLIYNTTIYSSPLSLRIVKRFKCSSVTSFTIFIFNFGAKWPHIQVLLVFQKFRQRDWHPLHNYKYHQGALGTLLCNNCPRTIGFSVQYARHCRAFIVNHLLWRDRKCHKTGSHFNARSISFKCSKDKPVESLDQMLVPS